MDRHFLTPLFAPRSIVVFAGDPDQPEAQSSLARAMVRELRAGGFEGELTYLDIETTGTLADLAHSRADLVLIALPHEQVCAALEIAGRIRCRAALVLSTGMPASSATAAFSANPQAGKWKALRCTATPWRGTAICWP